MKNIIKDENGSVAYLLLVGFFVTLIVAAGAFMFLHDMLYSFNLKTIYDGTPLADSITTEDIWYGNIFFIISDNILFLILIAMIIGLYLAAQRIGNQGG